MKTGKSLIELAQELESQRNSRKDLLAPQGLIKAIPTEADIKLDGLNGEPLLINNHAHGQLGDHLGIPAKYYTRMREADPELLAFNVNRWLQKAPNEKRLVRTLNGRVRGFLSSRYRPLDNFDLFEAILPTLLERRIQIVSSEITETRMYIKGILPELSEPLPDGLVWGSGHVDITKVAPGFQLPPDQQVFGPERRGRLVASIVISNSDVGAGTLRVEPSVFLTWCTNLAILVAAAMKKYHIGRAWEADSNFEVFRDDTREADDKAFFMKVRDVTQDAFREESFQAAIAQIKAAGGKEIKSANLEKVVDVTVRHLALPVGSAPGILSLLARGGDLTQWGLANAITAAANTAENYELATQLEYAGGQVLALDDKPWKAIANAA